MGAKTEIAWCDATWNVCEGCTKVSAGCQWCYAARMASRFSKAGEAYEGLAERGNWTGQVRLRPDRLDIPLRWRKPKRIFVNSMSDLFHEDVPNEFRDRVFHTVADCPQHTFMVLTKRAQEMWDYMQNVADSLYMLEPFGAKWTWPLPNVWLGVSVENQQAADERIPWLLKTPAAVRFVSAEPLLGPVNLNIRWLEDQCDQCNRTIPRNIHGCYNPYNGDDDCDGSPSGNPLIDWVITGGETGPGARPAHPDWFRGLRDQCAEAGVSYFHKQNGEWVESNMSPYSMPHPNWCALQYRGMTALTKGNMFNPFEAGHPGWKMMHRVGKARAGRLLDGVEHNAFPDVR